MSRTDKILNILYPRHCPMCHRILKDQNTMICPECVREVRPLTGSLCFRCGRPVEEEEEFCGECLRVSHVYDSGRGIFLYEDRWKKSLERYKFFGCREYGDFYARAMYLSAKEDIKRWNPDLIIPVPLHKTKQRMRGFNQSWYLAERIGRMAHIPARFDLVRKVKKTASQKKLDAVWRRRNLQDAFHVEGSLKGDRILVIDDVYTTGSTMDAMAGVLKKAGASRVCFLTCCIVPR